MDERQLRKAFDELAESGKVVAPLALEMQKGTFFAFFREAWEMSRRAALEEAAKAAADTDTVEAFGDTMYAQLGDAAATREAIVEAIEKLASDGLSDDTNK